MTALSLGTILQPEPTLGLSGGAVNPTQEASLDAGISRVLSANQCPNCKRGRTLAERCIYGDYCPVCLPVQACEVQR